MIWLYEKLMLLWDRLYSRHEKATKMVVCGLLLLLCVVMAFLQVHEMTSR